VQVGLSASTYNQHISMRGTTIEQTFGTTMKQTFGTTIEQNFALIVSMIFVHFRSKKALLECCVTVILQYST